MSSEKNFQNSIQKKITAELVKEQVVVWDHVEGSELYSMGFFGKPIGIRKPKAEQFDRPLELSMIEACYLLKQEKIDVQDPETKQLLTFQELFKISKELIPSFEEKMHVYEDLRKRGLVVRPGLKFGADFAVYHEGPGVDHSQYVVTALPRGSELTAIELVRAGRLATSVRKKFVIATILPNNDVRYYGFVWSKP
ncbi:MAG: tRNA-intron lyase [Candidatus Heimdallarchaeota archaeon]|nr:tRNA-intron lyase [Candidatus Heimdallarchaeota archaeon]